MSRGDVKCIAADEEDAIVWVARSASRWAVQRQVAAAWMRAPWLVAVTADDMRAATHADCPVHGAAAQDAAGCECERVLDDPYFLDCEPDHPDAIALWRCEFRRAPQWWYRFRRWQYRIGDMRRQRPVLWGGRADRQATWLDRTPFGGGRYGRVGGDRWFRLGESELLPCRLCRHVTPHVPAPRGRRWYGAPRAPLPPEPGRLQTNALLNVARHARDCRTQGDDRPETRGYAVKRLLWRWGHAQSRSARASAHYRMPLAEAAGRSARAQRSPIVWVRLCASISSGSCLSSTEDAGKRGDVFSPLLRDQPVKLLALPTSLLPFCRGVSAEYAQPFCLYIGGRGDVSSAGRSVRRICALARNTYGRSHDECSGRDEPTRVYGVRVVTTYSPAVDVIPAAAMRAGAACGRMGGGGIATAALRTAQRVGGDASLVLVAVASGEGRRLAGCLRGYPKPQRGGDRG